MQEAGWKTRTVFDRYDIVDEADMREARDRLDQFRAKRPPSAGEPLDPSGGGRETPTEIEDALDP